MATTEDVLQHILINYPHKSHLTSARTTKIGYLADWRNCLTKQTQITGIRWYYDHHGPFVWDFVDTAKRNPHRFALDSTANAFGSPSTTFRLVSPMFAPSLSQSDQESLNYVMQVTQGMNWSQFIQLVYSTYPIIKCDQYSYLDLPKLAKAYLGTSLVQE